MMSVQQAYNEWAATYDADRNLTRDLDAQITRETLDGRQHDIILELGCGTGKNTPFLAQIGARILALDFSESMLRRAQAKFYPVPTAFALADLTQPLPCAGARADLVTCNLVLEHLADLDAIFAQVARVLAPGGHFFVCELHPFRQYMGGKAVFQREQTPAEMPAFVHHISAFVAAGQQAGLTLLHLGEHWHADDAGKAPRLISLLFERSR
ncbi:MAG: class I SAM-dependent methyltransferase [Chloroflexota bacterium]|nr:class I SAM-dependent methyltransferase [Chloroflexota bacterium]